MIEAVIGAALLLDGHDLPRLHLIYGLTPIAVAFLAEQLRLTRHADAARPARLRGRRRCGEAPRSRSNARFVAAIAAT